MDLWTVLLAPILILQGKWVRLRTPKLPEAPGPRSGERGKGSPLSLLVLGDSAAAGVGIEHQERALSGHLVEALEPFFSLQWQLHARSGLTTTQAIPLVDAIEAKRFDVVLISLGVNDVLSPVTETRWLNQLAALTLTLKSRFDPKLILLTAVPPLGEFPALPWPLRAHLGRRANRFNAALTKWLQPQPDLALIQLGQSPEDLTPHLAPDRFHPGETTHQLWAQLASSQIRPHFAPPTIADCN
ncbi:SGNH/GDSL hydrolase family protein [Marinobacter hydrocarbonoclasticus]|nr:SGNH/GDSL hydrolase family protein [Marinobacter nauticus]